VLRLPANPSVRQIALEVFLIFLVSHGPTLCSPGKREKVRHFTTRASTKSALGTLKMRPRRKAPMDSRPERPFQRRPFGCPTEERRTRNLMRTDRIENAFGLSFRVRSESFVLYLSLPQASRARSPSAGQLAGSWPGDWRVRTIANVKVSLFKPRCAAGNSGNEPLSAGCAVFKNVVPTRAAHSKPRQGARFDERSTARGPGQRARIGRQGRWRASGRCTSADPTTLLGQSDVGTAMRRWTSSA
jgi:hypothetical protein